jgi:hypothetical protein
MMIAMHTNPDTRPATVKSMTIMKNIETKSIERMDPAVRGRFPFILQEQNS